MFLAVLRAELEGAKEKSDWPAPKLRKLPLLLSPRSRWILHLYRLGLALPQGMAKELRQERSVPRFGPALELGSQLFFS